MLLDAGKLPNIHVMFVGEGPDEHMLQEVTKVYGLEDYVSFFPLYLVSLITYLTA